jgi:hypothetical protein
MNPVKPFIIKRNDTFPTLSLNIKTRGDLNQVIPYNLSAVTACTFSMSDSYGNLKVSSAQATVLVASAGTIQYAWTTEDTDTSDKYNGEFELLFTGGNVMSIPNLGYINIEIIDDINDR